MYLKQLSFINYKNFESKSFVFDSKINCLVGNNGIGKTNVLDGIYHLSFGKSYFNPITSQNITHGEEFFVIDGEFEKQERTETIVVSAKRGQKKVIKRNGKAYDRFSEHIGLLPIVIISPADRDLIMEGSDTRRKFMDGIIAQNDKEYLDHLISYNKILAQRNALLKYFAANRTFEEATLQVYNHQLASLAEGIFIKRQLFLDNFIPIFKKRYKTISNANETVSIHYKSQLLRTPLLDLFKERLQKDLVRQYSTAGTHKDDLLFNIGEHPIKKFGSQGQQKSLLIALKLAQYDFIKEKSHVNPILLLDDIFDKLDEQRVAQIVSLVSKDELGQLFISDTHPDRTEAVVKQSAQEYKMFRL